MDERLATVAPSPPAARTRNARPSMQIYRPPGLRGATDRKPPSSIADSDLASNASSASSRSSGGSGSTLYSRRNASPPLTDVIACPSTSSKAIVSPLVDETPRAKPKNVAVATPRGSAVKEPKKKPFTRQDADEIGRVIRALSLESTAECALVDEFVAGEMVNDALARRLGETLARHGVEQRGKQRGKAVARACAALLCTPTAGAFHGGLRDVLAQFFADRVKLRDERPRVWIGLLAFACELCVSIGAQHEGGLATIVFDLFDYLLRSAELDSLRIEELECMMSALLSVGYDLERHCPERLGALQDALRDAFIAARESWARRMLLLMIELGAGGWQLAPDANEYYFQ